MKICVIDKNFDIIEFDIYKEENKFKTLLKLLSKLLI